MDSKSIGLCPQGFESPRCRFLEKLVDARLVTETPGTRRGHMIDDHHGITSAHGELHPQVAVAVVLVVLVVLAVFVVLVVVVVVGRRLALRKRQKAPHLCC